MRTYGGATGGGATPPTADAGPDQQQVGLDQVALSGSGSTAGAAMLWTLRDPANQNQDALLSSTTVISPTWTPTYGGMAGNWVATLAVTKDGITSYDSVNIRIGDAAGWITLTPDAASSTYTSGQYSTVTWGTSGDWTTLVLGPKTGGVTKCTSGEIKWITLDVNWEDLLGVELLVEADDTYTQPVNLDKFYAGAMIGTTTIPGAAYVGSQSLFWLSNRTESTSLSIRTNDQTFAFGMSSTGYNGMSVVYSKQAYTDAQIRRVYQKIDTPGSTNNSPADSSITIAPVGSNPVQVGLICARGGTTLGDITMKFAVKIRVLRR